MARPLIALDADGVLLDFHLGYAGAWERAFGSDAGRARPAGLLADGPLAGRAARRGRATPLPAPLRRSVLVLGAGDRGRRGRVPAPARRRLRPRLRIGARGRARERRACATCATTAFRSSASSRPATRPASSARRPTRSPRSIRTPSSTTTCPYLRGMPGHVHTALILRALNGSPNAGDEMATVDSTHADLGGFVDHWLSR